MFFLVGLLGMMAVGSIVIAGTADVEEGLEDDGLPPDDIGSADAETSVDSLLPALQDATDTAPVAEVISWPGPSADPMDIPTGQAGIDARDVSEPLSLFDVMGLSGLFGESQVDTPSVSSEQQAMPGDDALGAGSAGLTEDGTDDADTLTGTGATDLLNGGGAMTWSTDWAGPTTCMAATAQIPSEAGRATTRSTATAVTMFCAVTAVRTFCMATTATTASPETAARMYCRPGWETTCWMAAQATTPCTVARVRTSCAADVAPTRCWAVGAMTSLSASRATPMAPTWMQAIS